MPEKVSLIIPAAGEGRRMKSGVPKPFLMVDGVPLIHHTLGCFRGVEAVAQVIIALAPSETGRKRELLDAGLGVTDIVAGGDTRTESVSNALSAVRDDCGIVLIHDSVRPFVAKEVILGVIEAAGVYGAAIAAAPVKDTIKRVEKGAVVGTVSREGLYLAQTPQGFRLNSIREAYAGRGEGVFTDDASLIEAAGGRVEVVVSTHDNFKVTTPEDLVLAEAFLSKTRR